MTQASLARTPDVAPDEGADTSLGLASNRTAAGWALEVLKVLTEADLSCCVSHGYRSLPDAMGSDLDLLAPRTLDARVIGRILSKQEDRIGARVVHAGSSTITMSGTNGDGRPAFLTIDIAHDVKCGGRVVLGAAQVLQRRRRRLGFDVPAAADEFVLVLCSAAEQNLLKPERARDLELLFGEDAEACRNLVRELWPSPVADTVETAARTGEWAALRALLPRLGGSLRYHGDLSLGSRFMAAASRLRDQVGRLMQPPGLSIVLLGPDGAGKSTLSNALFEGLHAMLPRQESWGFAPPIARFIGRHNQLSSSDPHGLPRRSAAVSVVRALYWFTHALVTSAKRRVAKARSALVVYDRHFIDIFVDQRRYRYGGPMWVPRLLWFFIPKPDLVLLLDVPAEILQQRKQEVPPEVSAQQRSAYLKLAKRLPNARVLDGTLSREDVAKGAMAAAIDLLASRAKRRLR